MATKAKPKRKHSVSELSNYIGKLKGRYSVLQETFGDEEKFSEELGKIEIEFAKKLANTKMDDVPAAVLVRALCMSLDKAEDGDTIEDYAVPIVMTGKILAYYARSVYKTRNNFISAPATLAASRHPALGGLHDYFDAFLDKRMMSEASSSLDYALYQKLFSRLMGLKSAERRMTPQNFLEKYGSLEKEQAPPLHLGFAYWAWPEEKKQNNLDDNRSRDLFDFLEGEVRRKSAQSVYKMDMPGQPISNIEIYRLEDL
jgi:hypothetical protein